MESGPWYTKQEFFKTSRYHQKVLMKHVDTRAQGASIGARDQDWQELNAYVLKKTIKLHKIMNKKILNFLTVHL